MSRTKLVGYLMILVSVTNLVIDILNGGGVNFPHHFETISTALTGAGIVFMRDAISKISLTSEEITEVKNVAN